MMQEARGSGRAREQKGFKVRTAGLYTAPKTGQLSVTPRETRQTQFLPFEKPGRLAESDVFMPAKAISMVSGIC